MAAPPVKSQTLHNFSLPHLKWAHKNFSPSSSSHHHRGSPNEHNQSIPEAEAPPKNPKPEPPTGTDSFCAAVEDENGEARPWKLRPRKVAIRAASIARKETGAANSDSKNHNGMKSQRLKGVVEGGLKNGGGERKSKAKLWISLSREEIEEDIYALTGGKPARRPRKWPKNVQKQLDSVFPGLYLVGVAAEFYQMELYCRYKALRTGFDVNMEVESELFAATVSCLRYANLSNKTDDTADID